VEDTRLLADALQTAHGFVPVLTEVAGRLRDEIRRRGWDPSLAEPPGAEAATTSH